MGITIGGMFSGLDTTSIIQQLVNVQRIPVASLQTEKTKLSGQSEAYGFISSSLSTLKDKISALRDPSLFRAIAASSSNTAVGTASADTTAAAGSAKVEITALASQSARTGSKFTAFPAAGATAANTVFSSGFAGTLNVNGTQVTLADGDTLDQIATKLSVGGVAATYNGATGKFELASGSPVILATGTSNFFQQAQLFNNGTGSIQSSTAIGRTSTATVLGLAGDLTINGVTVSGITAADTLEQALDKITGSAAGVVATYDSFTDQVKLTAKNRGSLDIAVSGADATALKLDTGTLSVGNDTKFRVNDGAERVSVDNILSADELGVEGMSFTAISTGTTTITLGADTSKVTAAINAFVEQYNSAQNMIADYIKVNPTDSSKNGVLANDSTLTFLPGDLRSLAGTVYGTGTVRMLEDLGIKGNSSDNTLTSVDASALKGAMENNLDDLINIFTDATSGFAAKMSERIDAYATSGTGIISTRQTSITERQRSIDNEISLIELRVEAERRFLESQFAALESATGSSNQLSSVLSNMNQPASS